MDKWYEGRSQEEGFGPPEPKPDPRNKIVRNIHFALAAIIVTSQILTDSIIFGIYGLPLAVTLCIGGFLYSRFPGRNWYESELIPFLSQRYEISTEKKERLITYAATAKHNFLILSWLEGVIIQTYTNPLDFWLGGDMMFMHDQIMIIIMTIMLSSVIITINIGTLQVVVRGTERVFTDISDLLRAARGYIVSGID
ncbi:MAG: hypothetical protein K9W43_06805 [Candidatus Thorarchaeota archaeon]|nr:hypothetical protein [Candidatus Thorarchaeota archaeon]